MATVVVGSQARACPPTLPGRRHNHRFFSAMAILVLATVFIGFGPTYYWAGLVRAPLPSPIIHLHSAIFSARALLLVVQTSLLSLRRVDLHRRMGIAGFCLAGLMVILGLSAAVNSLFIFCAMRWRKDPASHKRFVILASVALLTAAFARFHIPFLRGNVYTRC